MGVVGLVWWGLAIVACVGWLASGLVREGSGHEILLEGEEEEEDYVAEPALSLDVVGGVRNAAQGSRPGYVREATQHALRTL